MASSPLAAVDAPSDNRIEPGSFNIGVAQFPRPLDVSSFDPTTVAQSVVAAFNYALKKKDPQAVGDLFLENSYWRDHLCLSWDFHTLKGGAGVLKFLQKQCPIQSVSIDSSVAHRSPQVVSLDTLGEVQCVSTFVNVTTDLGSGQGVLRLATSNGTWKIYTLFTTLREIRGHEELRGRRRWDRHAGGRDGMTWKETRDADNTFKGNDPAVLIIGAGQGGLTSGARLKMLGVDALIIDREARVGDNWRNRYKRLVLHDPVWFDHMPYMNFPDHWPVYTPKDKLADWFEAYVSALELNVWTKTELVSTSWDEDKKRWSVTVERQVGDRKESRTLHPRHIIQATGHSGKKNFPTFKGMDSFRGLLCHSSEFSGAIPNSKGRRAIVVGSCNSGHDIAQEYYENGYDVTMVQRSTTCVVSSHSITEIGLKGLYEEGGIPVDDADLINMSFPTELSKKLNIQTMEKQSSHDRQTLEGLAKVGFACDKGPNSAGLLFKYLQRGGGYYIDIGCSQLIIDGKIKIKQGVEIEQVLPDGLKFADGTVLPADEIVFATGYQNMRTQSRIIFGDQVADRLNDVWGFDEEGEFRAIWRRSGHPGFWYMGGNLALSRYYSLLLALQIKAQEEGFISQGIPRSRL